MQKSVITGFILAAGLATAPVLQASAAANSNNVSPAVEHPAGATATSQMNPLLTDNGSVRVGKLIGTDVYNSQDQKLGSVDGVIINKSGQPEVILSHNDKLVQVPWNDLQFGNAQKNSDNKVIIPNMTQNQLNSMQAFKYTARGNGNG